MGVHQAVATSLSGIGRGDEVLPLREDGVGGEIVERQMLEDAGDRPREPRNEVRGAGIDTLAVAQVQREGLRQHVDEATDAHLRLAQGQQRLDELLDDGEEVPAAPGFLEGVQCFDGALEIVADIHQVIRVAVGRF